VRQETVPHDDQRGRAAQYVRMSTDHQKYSTQNQEDAIAEYAELHTLTIVRTYADEGRSGLRLDRRQGLKDLISDVLTGRADFDRILVYDVSRWGRFEDADEGAHYEFICKEAGVRVEYCAEDFRNDGSLMSTLAKSLKRAMAHQFSRDLSAKVFAGQCRLTRLGFWQGGPAGYGMQRELIDENRRPKLRLARGERKSIQTDRVILQPGPLHEVETVQRIFRSYAIDGKYEVEIARELNREGITNQFGRRWNRNTIWYILTSEKYAGHNVYNRVSHKLKQKHVKNLPSMWVRSDNAFRPIIEQDLFTAAAQKISERGRPSDEQMLTRLASLLRKTGHLSSEVIDGYEGTPCAASYHRRFGSLRHAYKLIGYEQKVNLNFVDVRRNFYQRSLGVVADVVAEFDRFDPSTNFDKATRLLTINNEFSISIFVLRCLRTNCGSLQWNLRCRRKFSSDTIVAVRMDDTNENIFDYLLLPTLQLSVRLRFSRLRFSESNPTSLGAYRFGTFDALLHGLRGRLSAVKPSVKD
jgi:DNA invertase Pin-like site-specific DNA recombinase